MALIPTVGRTQPRLRIAWWIVVGLLCLGVLLHLFPFYYMLVISVTPAGQTLAGTPNLLPYGRPLRSARRPGSRRDRDENRASAAPSR